MSTSDVSHEPEPRRFATSGVDGVLHEVVAYTPRSGTYTALCGAIIPARSTEVHRARWAPGVLCRSCAIKTAGVT